MVCVPDLDRGIDTYRRLGFNVDPGGIHPGIGSHNAIAFNDEDYLELLAIRDRTEYDRASPFKLAGSTLGRGGGLAYAIVSSDDLAADVVAMRRRGVDIGDISEGRRRTAGGQELRWKLAMLGKRSTLPLFFIEHVTPLEIRRAQNPGAGLHPNQVQRIERAYIAVTELPREAQTYEKVLGVKPKIERGTVINADMAVFQLGPSAVTLAQPFGPGVTARALEHNGPGPFQVLFRTKSMDAAASCLSRNGVPPPARGVRNTGEQAMLVPPEHACGAYIGFVGMP